MRKIKLVVVALAATAGLLTAPAAAYAATRPAESVYTTSYMDRCFDDEQNTIDYAVECIHLQVYTTYSATQIWINGHVTCNPFAKLFGPVPVDITWCGVGGGNGTAYLNIGVNWNVPTWHADNLYERMDIVKNGEGCTTPGGSNSAVGDLSGWSTRNLTCEAPA